MISVNGFGMELHQLCPEVARCRLVDVIFPVVGGFLFHGHPEWHFARKH